MGGKNIGLNILTETPFFMGECANFKDEVTFGNKKKVVEVLEPRRP
jgi:hypothetical protein